MAVALLACPVLARAASLTAGLDREAVAPGEPFIFEVSLSAADESVEGFRAPDFHGLQVLSAPQFPSRSTSVQIGGGQQVVQNSYTWTFQLALPSGVKGSLNIGAAHVRVGGRELASNPVPVRIGASSGGQRPRPAGRGNPFQQLFGGPQMRSPIDDDPAAAVSSTPSAAFIRVVPDKTRAFVGQQVTVAWYLYLSQEQNKYETLSEPHTDGFWSEEIPSTNPSGRLSFTPENQGGRTYNVALLFKKALFPLQAGKLTITSMEAQVAQVDFFGTPVRARRLKTEPVVIDAEPLPREGAPAHFETGNVGHYEISATVDRSAVTVGDAVTLKVVVKGTGNVRNVQPPALPPLDGWKSYEPKSDVAVDGGEVISGTKTVEWLLRPERAGKTAVPPLVLETFDPASKRYRAVRSQPFELVVTGEGARPRPVARRRAGGGRRERDQRDHSADPGAEPSERRGGPGLPARRRVAGHRGHAAAGAGAARALRAGARAARPRFAPHAAAPGADHGAPPSAGRRGAPGGRAGHRFLPGDRSGAARGAQRAAPHGGGRVAARRAGVAADRARAAG